MNQSGSVAQKLAIQSKTAVGSNVNANPMRHVEATKLPN
jgi:hypothetical protein